MSMKIGIPKEVHAGERRVAATPETAKQLIKLGFSVAIEAGAGSAANFSDEAIERPPSERGLASLTFIVRPFISLPCNPPIA